MQFSSGPNRSLPRRGLAAQPLLRVGGARAQTPGDLPPGGPLPSWNDGAAKAAILDLVRSTTNSASPEFRRPRGARRHIRSGRHDLGRASGRYPGGLLPRAGVPAVVEAKPELKDVERLKTVLSGDTARRSEKLPTEELLRDPLRRRSAGYGRCVPAPWRKMDCDRKASALGPALHGSDLSADAGSHALSAREWLQNLYRHRRRRQLRRSQLPPPARKLHLLSRIEQYR